MNIPNPMSEISKWLENRAVNKVRDQYKTSIESYKNRHSSTKEKDGLFVVLGVIGYLATMISGAYLRDELIFLSGIFVMIGFLMLSQVMSWVQQWKLKGKLTLTIKVIPNDPEKTRPVTLRFEGVTFGAALDTPDKLMKFVHEQKGHLTHTLIFRTEYKGHLKHAFSSKENGTAQKTITKMQDMDNKLKLYPMWSKKDPVPTLMQMPNDPDSEFRAQEEKVRLSYGMGYIRHATIMVAECDPIPTSIRVKSKIVDVEFTLYSLFSSQKTVDDRLSGASWHVPNRTAQAVATYVKQEIDNTKNASFFAGLEKQRDDAIRGREKLQLQNKNEQMNADLDGEMMRGYKKMPGMYSFSDVVWWLIVSFIAGVAFLYIVGGY